MDFSIFAPRSPSLPFPSPSYLLSLQLIVMTVAVAENLGRRQPYNPIILQRGAFRGDYQVIRPRLLAPLMSDALYDAITARYGFVVPDEYRRLQSLDR